MKNQYVTPSTENVQLVTAYGNMVSVSYSGEPYNKGGL